MDTPAISPLLKTKLFIPPRRDGWVERSRLAERIEAAAHKSLTLVSAPAGFGKTTLLADWARGGRMPVAWLSLDAEDNDPGRFLSYLVAALTQLFEKVGADVRLMLASPQPIPSQAILASLINDLAEVEGTFALVLDDCQFITSPAVMECLAYLLEHMPAQMRLILATRSDPPLPLHRLRARGQMAEIRTDDLRFDTGEAAIFLRQAMGLRLGEEETGRLEERTEGWAAGLQMAALALQSIQSRPDGQEASRRFIADFGGSQRYILEYLLEEVLAQQPQEVQDFLLRTSILDRFSAGLCEAVTGDKVQGKRGGENSYPLSAIPSSDSQTMLDDLLRANLFLVPLDDQNDWFRYHHLFADLLQARLRQTRPGEIPGLHSRASEWLEAQGLDLEAIQHARAAGDFDRAARLVENRAMAILTRGELSTLLGQIQALPEEAKRGRPRLSLLHAAALTFAGQLDAAEARLEQAEAQASPDEADTTGGRALSGGIAIYRALIAELRGDLPLAVELAERAGTLLPETEPLQRSLIPFILGDGYYQAGDLGRAEQAFSEIVRIGRSLDNLWTISVGLGRLGTLYRVSGRLRQAEEAYRQALEMAAARGGSRFGTLGAIHTGLADLLREWNELEQAQQEITRAFEIMRAWASPSDLAFALIVQARIHLDREALQPAEASLREATRLMQASATFQALRGLYDACQVRLWQRQGDREAAKRWAEAEERDDFQADDFPGEMRRICRGRALILTGQPEEAERLLERLALWAEAGERSGRLVEILALLAAARQAQGQTAPALAALEKALRLAASEGYVRTFLDGGEGLAGLLDQFSSAKDTKAGSHLISYAKKVVGANPRTVGAPISTKAAAQPLPEPLTAREMEVLRLICQGDTNQQIAEKLVVSLNTVKRHNNSIFAKLGVANRSQAIVLAGRLGLA